MTTTTDAILALRAAIVAATSAEDEAMRAPSASPAFAACEVVRIPGAAAIAHVAVELAKPVRLPELEAVFGPARKLPLRPDGGSTRPVIFDDTIPAGGSTGATLLADVPENGLVARIVVRRDVL